MTTPRRNGTRTRPAVDSDAFSAFLTLLANDPEEAGRQYTRLHHKLVGFFSLKGLSDPDFAADEAIDRAIVKIKAGVPVPDVGRYCFGIARNIVKEGWRQAQRESSAFEKFSETMHHSDEMVDRIYELLKPCFEELNADERKLLLSYCEVAQGRARAEHRRKLAESMKTTVSALRIRVTRLRNILTECVKRRALRLVQ